MNRVLKQAFRCSFSQEMSLPLSFFNCHVMKADANELCGVGLPLAQVELILYCGCKLHLPASTHVLALAHWTPGHQLGEFISFKSKATRRQSFHIVQLVSSAGTTLTEGTESGA